MGCDIHLYVERKVDGVWTTADKWTEEEWPGEQQKHLRVDLPYYGGRDYDLFAILANVRNGRGFAGIKMGEGFVPISEPRGIPEDASPEYLKIQEQWGEDGHSHSYHTLQQLLDYDWTQVTKSCGILSFYEYIEWNRWSRQEGNVPGSYCGGVTGGGVKVLSEEEFKTFVEDKFPQRNIFHISEEELEKALKDIYVRCEWEIPYHRAVGPYFWTITIPKLLRLGKPEDVRIVFFFDN